jgi:hypothetical protein
LDLKGRAKWLALFCWVKCQKSAKVMAVLSGFLVVKKRKGMAVRELGKEE